MTENDRKIIEKINQGVYTKEELNNLKRNALEKNRPHILDAIELRMPNQNPRIGKSKVNFKKDLLDENSFKTRYALIRNELKEKSPSIWEEVLELCKQVPETIDKQIIWKFGRDKPCFSHIKVHVGERIAADLQLSQSFQSFSEISSPSWDIEIMERGRKWSQNSNFKVLGNSANQFLKELSNGGFKSYLWRLYAIRQFAIALNYPEGAVCKLLNHLIAKQYLESNELKKWTTSFARAVGLGWGFITANHMLTDLGVSIKPDLHLRRTAILMGLFPNIDTGLSTNEIDNLHKHKEYRDIDFEIVERLVDLSQYTEPTALPSVEGTLKRKVVLREIDKVLMEWSRQKLSRPLGNM